MSTAHIFNNRGCGFRKHCLLLNHSNWLKYGVAGFFNPLVLFFLRFRAVFYLESSNAIIIMVVFHVGGEELFGLSREPLAWGFILRSFSPFFLREKDYATDEHG